MLIQTEGLMTLISCATKMNKKEKDIPKDSQRTSRRVGRRERGSSERNVVRIESVVDKLFKQKRLL